MIKDIPIILTNFNQLNYTKMLVAQCKFYCPQNPLFIIDNNSSYQPVLDYYWKNPDFVLYRYPENDFVKNVTEFLSTLNSDYFVLSDVDIQIHPTTCLNFLEIFKEIIDLGVHHVGFDLIYDDLPEWNKKAGWIAGDEKALHSKEYEFFFNEKFYYGWKAPIDTTFAMYKKGGWAAPMKPEHWDNSVRMFKAFHQTWYLHPDYLNDEMKNYFATCLKRDDSKPSAGRNHFYPE